MVKELTMLYAPVNKRAMWMLAWEELEYLEKELRRINANYQVSAEQRMFESQDLPAHRFVLLKWDVNPKNLERKREVVLETHDVQHMASVMKMLLSIEKESVDAYKH
jgi:hypothetical protein